MSNVLIFGGGSKFGLSLTDAFKDAGNTVYKVSGSAQDQNTLTVNWKTCFINDFEKFLTGLPNLDVVIFNQNASSLPEHFHKLGSMDTLEMWKQSKNYLQSYYVNCVLPQHALHTLSSSKKLNSNSKIVWMLSRSIFNPKSAPSDYAGQKYQNFVTLQKLANYNDQTFIGVCPGLLTQDTYKNKSQHLCNFLTQENMNHYSGKFLAFDQLTETFKII